MTRLLTAAPALHWTAVKAAVDSYVAAVSQPAWIASTEAWSRLHSRGGSPAWERPRLGCQSLACSRVKLPPHQNEWWLRLFPSRELPQTRSHSQRQVLPFQRRQPRASQEPSAGVRPKYPKHGAVPDPCCPASSP